MLRFKDNKHEEAFDDFLIAADVRKNDTKLASLFYLLAMFEETRNNIYDLYDFKYGKIIEDGLYKPWQSDNSLKCTMLAFNLFNGYTGTDEENCSTVEIFSIDEYRKYFVEAIRIRFGDIFK